jgi:pimeloyl-ACP methyl ester carboxylesterase
MVTGSIDGSSGGVGSPDAVVTVPVAPGVSLTVDVWDGTRPGVVLVHGLASNARLWDGVVAEMRRRGHAAATVDLRGHGRSAKPDRGYDTPTVAEDLVAVLAMLRARDRRVWRLPVVAGQSWGGNVVVELAGRHPELVVGVVGVDGGVIELAERFADRDAARRALTPPVLVGTPAPAMERALRTAHPHWSAEAIAGVMANFEVRPDGTVAPWLTLERHLRIVDGLWEHRPSRILPALEVPLVLLMADDGRAPAWADDKRAAVDRAVAIAGAGARARWFVPADHDLHAEQPAAVAAELADAAMRWAVGPPTAGRPGGTEDTDIPGSRVSP